MPPEFWDHFILRVYFGFCQEYPPGRDAACRVIELAGRLGFLNFHALSDLSLQIIVVACSPGLLSRAASAELIQNRSGNAPEWPDQLLGACPRSVDDLVNSSLGASLESHQLIYQAVTQRYLPGLSRFLSRTFFLEGRDAPGRADIVLLGSFNTWNIEQAGALDFSGHVYRDLLLFALDKEPVEGLPEELPRWAQRALQSGSDEIGFLRCSLQLLGTRFPRYALYLSFYAGASIGDIASALESSARRQQRREFVVQALLRCWEDVLRCMAPPNQGPQPSRNGWNKPAGT